MTRKAILLSLLISGLTTAQVGVNIAEPNTTLDVSAKRNSANVLTDTAQTYGLQAPRLTRAELASLTAPYGTNQNGALVYITDITGGDALGQRINVNTIGYYYFDGALWQKVANQNIYSNDGTIANPFRTVRMYTSTASKIGFNASFSAASTSQKTRMPTFSFLGGEVNNMVFQNGSSLSTADYKFESTGALFSNSTVGFYPKYSYLFSSNFSDVARLWQMMTGRAANGTDTNDLFIGGIPDSKIVANPGTISFVVDADLNLNNYAFDNSTTPMVINGTGTEISAGVYRSTVTINNTDLYLTNLENVTPSTEAEGQVLTLIQNPSDINKVKAVWRTPGTSASQSRAIVRTTQNRTILDTDEIVVNDAAVPVTYTFTSSYPAGKSLLIVNKSTQDISTDPPVGGSIMSDNNTSIQINTSAEYIHLGSGEWIRVNAN